MSNFEDLNLPKNIHHCHEPKMIPPIKVTPMNEKKRQMLFGSGAKIKVKPTSSTSSATSNSGSTLSDEELIALLATVSASIAEQVKGVVAETAEFAETKTHIEENTSNISSLETRVTANESSLSKAVFTDTPGYVQLAKSHQELADTVKEIEASVSLQNVRIGNDITPRVEAAEDFIDDSERKFQEVDKTLYELNKKITVVAESGLDIDDAGLQQKFNEYYSSATTYAENASTLSLNSAKVYTDEKYNILSEKISVVSASIDGINTSLDEFIEQNSNN